MDRRAAGGDLGRRVAGGAEAVLGGKVRAVGVLGSDDVLGCCAVS